MNESWTGVTENSDPDTLPQAADDTLTGVSEDATGAAAYEIPVAALLANDDGGEAKTLYSVESLSAALVTITPDGTTIFYDTNGAFAYLADGETATDTWEYTIRLANGALSTARVTLTITGRNDGPVIDAAASTVTGAIRELTEGAAGEGAIRHSASGAIAYSDLDLSDTHTASVLPQGDGYRGTFTLGAAADGTLAWSLEVDDATIEDLAEGQTLTQSYDVTVDDGNGGTATETVVVTLTGSNDAVMITAEDLSGAVVEDAADPTLADNGTIGFEDVDLSDVHSASSVFKSSTHGGQLGAFSAAVTTPTGGGTGGLVTWSFSVANAAVQFLGAGDTITETYTVTLTDNEGSTVERDIAVTLTGSNDAPIVEALAGDSAGTATPLPETDAGLETSGTLTVTDEDTSDELSVSVQSVTAAGNTGGLTSAHLLGFFSVAPTSLAADIGTTENLAWSFDTGSEALDFLSADDLLELQYLVRATDDSGAGNNIGVGVVTIRVQGTNDAPVIDTAASTLSGDVTEFHTQDDLDGDGVLNDVDNAPTAYNPDQADSDGDGIGDGVDDDSQDSFTATSSDPGIHFASGQIVSSDVDNGDTPTASVDASAATLVYTPSGSTMAGTLPTGLDAAAIRASFSVAAAGAWSYDASALNFEALAAGDTIVLSYNVVVSDGDLTDIETVQIALNGTNDAPVAVADTVAINEDDMLAVDPAGVLTNDTDPDAGDSKTVVAVNGSAGNVGTAITLASGATVQINADGSYQVDTKGAYDYLIDGDGIVETVSYTVSDGTETSTTTVEIAIAGQNDDPDARDDLLGTDENVLLYGSLFVDSGNGADTDVDQGDGLTVTAVNGAGVGSTITLDSGALLTVNADGTFSYDANGAFGLAHGTTKVDSFEYTITDNYGGTDTATAYVTVTGVNTEPVVLTVGTVDMFGGSAAAGTDGVYGATGSANDVAPDGTAGTAGAGGLSAKADHSNNSYEGAAGDDVFTIYSESLAERGGMGGAGGWGGIGGRYKEWDGWNGVYRVHYGTAGNGGSGGDGGKGGDATSRFSGNSVAAYAGGDSIAFLIDAWGGDGGLGNAGGTGGHGGNTGHISSFWHYHRSSFGDSYHWHAPEDHYGGDHGDGGLGGRGGAGGAVLADVTLNSAFGSSEADILKINVRAGAGDGGHAGNGGYSRGDAPYWAGFDYPASQGGHAGGGGAGGLAEARITTNTLDGGAGDDTLIIEVSVVGGDAGDGGDAATYAHLHYGVGAYYGHAGDGGAGGPGGAATVTVSGNELLGGDGHDTIGIQVTALGGAAGGGGTSTAASNGVIGAQGADGSTGAANVIVTKNVLNGGDGDDVLSLSVAANGAAGDYEIRGNTFDGGLGHDVLDFSGLDRGVQFDFAKGTATISITGSNAGLSGVNSVSGIEHVIGSSAKDAISGSAANEILQGSAGDDLLSGLAGSDRFVFAAGAGKDIITDFEQGMDALELQGGLTLASRSEVDSDKDGIADGTVVMFSDGSSVLLENVAGVTSDQDLLL